MKTRWWKLKILCPQCQIETNMAEMEYSADGEMKFHFVCPKCRQDIGWNTFSTVLQHLALVYDLQTMSKGDAPPTPPTPQRTPTEKKESDDDFLKGIGLK